MKHIQGKIIIFVLVIATMALLFVAKYLIYSPSKAEEQPVTTSNNLWDTTFQIPQNMQDYTAYIPNLMFHNIANVPADSDDDFAYKLSFAPESLEQFLLYFQQNNITTITFWDLKEMIEGKKSFPPKTVMLSFDDGYLDQYQNAFSLLKKYNMKGVFYIISNRPNNDPNYATWDQIKEMSQNGQEIGSHSVSHADLVNIPQEDMVNEVKTSKETIEEQIEKPVISFCYPAGIYDQNVLRVVKENYLFARTTIPGKEFSIQNRYEIPAERMLPTTGVASLQIWFDDSQYQLE